MTTIEIRQPEVEELIEERMASGAFHDVEELLLQALKSVSLPMATLSRQVNRQDTLEEMFCKVRGFADDLDFKRDHSPGSLVDLS